MSYLVLARKYRPTAFADVAGQEVVTRTLRGAIAEARIGHAYLFFGPRGTGKTTSARLFAKALNCEKGPIEEPCGTCDRCLSYDAGTEPDLIEIDAASNTGVDHVRNLRDQAGYVPLKARFKVFLIDEVHMLSKAAFNALLKTLEEPPPHVKFLFATTELHKVPDTVVSRCQVLRLSPLSEEQIVGRLDEVFQLEGVEAEAGVSAEIARRARGGMRDALSLADQLLALVGRTPKVEDTARLAGEGSTESIEAVLDAILAEDKVGLLKALPAREGDEPAFLDAVLGYLRSAMLLRLIGEDAPMVASSASPEAKKAMSERASKFGAERLELVLQELLHARERMGPIHMRAHARLILESSLLDLCSAAATMPVEQLVQRLEALGGRLAAGGPAPTPRAARPLAAAPPPARAEAPAPPTAPAPAASTGYTPPPRAPQKAAPAPVHELRPQAPPQAPPQAASPAPPQPPRPARRRGGRGRGAAPSVQTNSTADRWIGFLRELKRKDAALADLLYKKGNLVRDLGGVAPLKLRGLSDEERNGLRDSRAHTMMETAFAAAVGDSVRLKIEIHDDDAGGLDDAFTTEVKELFGGRVED